jgi:hypothetical protein
MKEEVIVFYCWTYAQLVNMVNLKLNQYDWKKGYLYIADGENIERYKAFLQRLEENSIFEVIRQFDYSGQSSCKGVVARKKYREQIVLDYFLKDFALSNQIDFVCAGYWVDSLMILRMLNKMNGNIHVHLIEEGVDLANGKALYMNLSLQKRIEYGGFFYKKYERLIEDYYVYFLRKSCKNYPLAMKFLPRICNDNPVKGLLQCVKLLDSVHETYKGRVVYFDSNCKNENLTDNLWIYKEIFEQCDKLINNKKVLVRCHPSNKARMEAFKRLNEIEICNDGVTTEALLVSDINWNKNVICVINSSIALNAKMIYGYEPYLVVLYKLLKQEKLEGIDELLDSYSDKRKIIVPTTMNNLKQTLESWTKNGKMV